VILIEAFDPMEVGDVDNLVLRFTKEAGDADLLDAQWECRLTAYSAGFDPDPMSRITVTQVQTVITVTQQDGSLVPENGKFAIARVGPLPPSAAGATYLFSASAFMSDGRKVTRSGYVQCVLPGQ